MGTLKYKMQYGFSVLKPLKGGVSRSEMREEFCMCFSLYKQKTPNGVKLKLLPSLPAGVHAKAGEQSVCRKEKTKNQLRSVRSRLFFFVGENTNKGGIPTVTLST